ncbi:MAG: DNA repair protein RecN [Lachnospiraceae bacterium]|nr:DNA repair protein RecN [Lachnospiraceae bacterium]
MLQTLYVKNMALIDEVEVELRDGLNILTGETGAGKSIIIDSISFALGEKVDKHMVRDKKEAGYVELIFSQLSDSVMAQLRELEIEPEDDTVILSRKLTGGRSVAKINGESVPASRLKEAAACLIDIHGQHEHQSLLHSSKHLEYLDDYASAELQDKKQELAEAYKAYISCKKQLEEQCTDKEEQAREQSFLEYEVSEILAAKLIPGEDEELESEYRRMTNSKKIMEALQLAEQAAGENGASSMIGRGVRELSAVSTYDEQLNGLAEQFSQIEELLSDFHRELTGYMDSAQFDGERFAQVEARLDAINRLKSKYGSSIEAILVSCEEKQARIDQLRNFDTYEKQLREQYEKATEQVDELCSQISEIRKTAGVTLREKMLQALQDLNFLDVQFDLQFTRTARYSANGFDAMEFLISTNPGEPPRALKDIASGGELSRIMLALKSVLAENDEIDTLIFDEIDTGISGRTAQMVSQKLHMIAQKHQVICITHLPQIAAMADAHFYIEKNVIDASTVTHLTLLDEEQSVAELGRMLGGVAVTDKVIESAREMKKLAMQAK